MNEMMMCQRGRFQIFTSHHLQKKGSNTKTQKERDGRIHFEKRKNRKTEQLIHMVRYASSSSSSITHTHKTQRQRKTQESERRDINEQKIQVQQIVSDAMACCVSEYDQTS